jgi:hypothetical protein
MESGRFVLPDITARWWRFPGGLFLLLALVYLRVILPHEREEIVRSDQVG